MKKGLKTEKNRQGLTGKQVMEFDGDHMRFIETDEDIKQAKKQVEEDENPFMEF